VVMIDLLAPVSVRSTPPATTPAAAPLTPIETGK